MNILYYFKKAIENKASDIFLAGGSFPALRIQGKIVTLEEKIIDPKDFEKSIYDFIFGRGREKFKKDKELDLSYEYEGNRFRVNFHYQENKVGLTARLIPNKILKPEELGLGNIVYELTKLKNGLIIISGPSGSGKSTTLASLVDVINHNRKEHIVTIEDPIEFIFEEDKCIIEQRELGQDTLSYEQALKYVLRQSPNVIVIGELRDIKTISLTLSTAETGHLVLATLHTASATESLKRIVDIFPAHQRPRVSQQLAAVLRGVIAQQLAPGIDGRQYLAHEILLNNEAVSNLICENKFNQIDTVIQTNSKDGMQTMDKSLEQLFLDNKISKETIIAYQQDRKFIKNK